MNDVYFGHIKRFLVRWLEVEGRTDLDKKFADAMKEFGNGRGD